MVSFRANLMIYRLEKQKQFWIFDADSGKKTRVKDYLLIDPHTSGDRLHIRNDESKQVQDEKTPQVSELQSTKKMDTKKYSRMGSFRANSTIG